MPNPKQYYDPHPGVAMVRQWLDTLKEKTGRDIDEWATFVLKNGPSGTKERQAWLKKEHALGTNGAAWIVDTAEGGTEIEDGDPKRNAGKGHEFVESMFAGAKSGLRPLYDQLYALSRSIGKDIRLCPCKTIVPVYRNHVIAQIKPATRARIDFGLALKDTPAKGRLIDTGGLAKKDRITHRIEITRLDDIDGFVESWLRKAYGMDAG
jgi:hypothetical protein